MIKAAGTGKIEYVDFPEVLRGKYQSFTQADMSWVKELGCGHRFAAIEDAVSEYYALLEKNDGYLDNMNP